MPVVLLILTIRICCHDRRSTTRLNSKLIAQSPSKFRLDSGRLQFILYKHALALSLSLIVTNNLYLCIYVIFLIIFGRKFHPRNIIQ